MKLGVDTVATPSKFTDEVFDEICARLAIGQTLTQICRDPEMPERATVVRWTNNDDARRLKYDKARRDGTDALADELVDIAWDVSKDTVRNERGTAVANHEWIARSRLKSETIRFLLMKLNPRRYGDKLPEAIEARQMELDAEKQLADARRIDPVRIELIGGNSDLDENGVPYPNGPTALRARIAELEAQLAGRDRPESPKLLTHDPGLPRRMDKDIAARMVKMIRDCVPIAGNRDPAAVLDEILHVCGDALARHFGQPMERIIPKPPY
jgi:hypothetical protein